MKKRPEEMSPKGRRGAEQLIRYHQTHKKERALHTAQLNTPEVKEKSLATRRFRAEIKEHIEGIFDKYKDMSYGEMKERLKKMEANPNKYKFSDYQVLQYMLNKKNTIDFFDRFIGKAPNLVDLKTEAQGSVIVVQDTVFEGGGVYSENEGGYVQSGTPEKAEKVEVVEGKKEEESESPAPSKRKRGRPRKSEPRKEK